MHIIMLVAQMMLVAQPQVIQETQRTQETITIHLRQQIIHQILVIIVH